MTIALHDLLGDDRSRFTCFPSSTRSRRSTIRRSRADSAAWRAPTAFRAKDVYEMDASKQTTRMSANVSGFGNTMRITLNDNLLRRGSPEEIQAVMGHEMGHYVLNHIPKDMHVLRRRDCLVFFAFLKWSLQWSLGALGREVADSRHRRSRGLAAGGAAGVDLLLRAHAVPQHPYPHHRSAKPTCTG